MNSSSRLSSSIKVLERWGESFHLPETCNAWRYSDMDALCATRFGIIVRHACSHTKSGEIGVTTTMKYHGLPLSITNDMARLRRYFDVWPEQLPPLVLLVYICAILLESYFQV